MQTVDDNTFAAEVIGSDVPVVVDFWAEWCGPCKALAPVLEALSGDFSGRAKFVKMNVEESAAAPANFNIRSLPTLMVFKGGKPVGQPLVGAKPLNWHDQN